LKFACNNVTSFQLNANVNVLKMAYEQATVCNSVAEEDFY
jgi:hypothetical protein